MSSPSHQSPRPSRSPSTRYARRYSRSRSPRPGRSSRRSHSRSPMSNRRRHVGSRDAPPDSKCLGVFGINLYTTERELEKEFGKFGPLEKVQIILDGKTGRSRGFGFVYFESVEDASAAKEALNGQEIDNRKIRVDFSITKRAHTPTPGVYMGRPTFTGRDEGHQQGNRRGYDGGGGYNQGREGGHYGRGGGHYGRDGGYYGGGGGGGGYGGRRSPDFSYRRSGRRDYRSRSRSYSPRDRSYY